MLRRGALLLLAVLAGSGCVVLAVPGPSEPCLCSTSPGMATGSSGPAVGVEVQGPVDGSCTCP